MRLSPVRVCLVVSCVVALGLSARAQQWTPGARVIVEKAGAGHRAIVLRSEAGRTFVAYEGADEQHDEWVEPHRLRSATPLRPEPSAERPPADRAVDDPGATPLPEDMMDELLPHALELPRVARGAEVAESWLEHLPRATPDEPARFQLATLAVPRFDAESVVGIPTNRSPLRAVLLYSQGRVRGFAAIESGLVLYARDPEHGFVRAGEVDLSSLGNFGPEFLHGADVNQDGETDLVVAGGPVVQVFFGSASGVFVPSLKPYQALEPIGGLTAGRFFTGPLPYGLAVIEGFNTLRLLNVAQSELAVAGDAFAVKFDRVTRIAAGDFDGDGFSDLVVATEHRGRSAGAWMYFNQRGTTRPFLWPVGAQDDFARDLLVADLDRDGRDDVILSDSDVDRGARVRVVFGAAGRAGWEDPWELIAAEYSLGLGTASLVVGDFNRDGRLDVGVGGRNGLRVYAGADYRRFSRNPVWPQLAPRGEFPEQRVFLSGDFDGDGASDLLGYTPVFATGYNVLFNATPVSVATHVPAPLKRRATARQASSTTASVEQSLPEDAAPVLRYLASRAEPYGQYRYRLIVELAAITPGVVEMVEASCKFEGADQPLQQLPAAARREGEQQWFVEITLPRGRTYEFTIVARDDKGRQSEPLRVTMSP